MASEDDQTVNRADDELDRLVFERHFPGADRRAIAYAGMRAATFHRGRKPRDGSPFPRALADGERQVCGGSFGWWIVSDRARGEDCYAFWSWREEIKRWVCFPLAGLESDESACNMGVWIDEYQMYHQIDEASSPRGYYIEADAQPPCLRSKPLNG